MRKKKQKNYFYYILPFLVLLIIPPLFIHKLYNPIEFNQFLIQDLEIEYGAATPEIFLDKFVSIYSSGLNILFKKTIKDQPDFYDNQSVFEYVFSWVPPRAVVYPTEGFYYYNFNLNGKNISGNIRIADLDKGSISVAYFTVPEKETRYLRIRKEDGLSIKKLSDYSYYVGYKNKEVRFKLPKTTIPKKLNLLSEEEFVGQIHDESGVRLFLIFNHKTNSFYMLLNEEHGLTEDLDSLGKNSFVGKRTGFIFYDYRDKKYPRKILVGVHILNIASNNFFDGPGDQVPFRAHLRPKLYLAYPQTLKDAGIDQHGVYLNKSEWVRIAISPYIRYNSYTEIFKRIEECNNKIDSSLFLTCLTREWWNTPSWIRDIERQLEKEGKKMPKNIEEAETIENFLFPLINQ